MWLIYVFIQHTNNKTGFRQTTTLSTLFERKTKITGWWQLSKYLEWRQDWSSDWGTHHLHHGTVTADQSVDRHCYLEAAAAAGRTSHVNPSAPAAIKPASYSTVDLTDNIVADFFWLCWSWCSLSRHFDFVDVWLKLSFHFFLVLVWISIVILWDCKNTANTYKNMCLLYFCNLTAVCCVCLSARCSMCKIWPFELYRIKNELF